MKNKTTTELGNAAEEQAVHYLRTKGYEILDRNWRFNRAELDIIARIGNDLVVVEVKSRKNNRFGYPEVSVNEAKKQKLLEGITEYRSRHHLESLEVRFDIIAITSEGTEKGLEHFEDAFFPGWF